MPLTYVQFAGTGTTQTQAIPNTTTGSLLIVMYLVTGQTANPNPSCTDTAGNVYTLVSQSLVPYLSTSNNIYAFVTKNVGSGSITATIALTTGAGGVYRMGIAEYTGQAAVNNPTVCVTGTSYITPGTNTVLTAAGSGSGGTTGTGKIPMLLLWTDLTAIRVEWINPGTSNVSIDGGSGTNRRFVGAGFFVGDRQSLKGPGFYTPLVTSTGAGSSAGNIIMVRSATAKRLASGLLLGV